MVTSDYSNPYHRILFTYLTDRYIQQHEEGHPDILIFKDNFIARDLLQRVGWDEIPKSVVVGNKDILDSLLSMETFAETKKDFDNFIRQVPYSLTNDAIFEPFHGSFPKFDHFESFHKPSKEILDKMTLEERYKIYPYHSFYIRKMLLLNAYAKGHDFTRDEKDDMYCKMFKGLLHDYDAI
jgi:hypothetical protein